ncbi:unnamed protein product [Symbiodinium sp. CCMP2592]|nr:unnamed protein product [Symbiodinium sp. CCMP2592]
MPCPSCREAVEEEPNSPAEFADDVENKPEKASVASKLKKGKNSKKGKAKVQKKHLKSKASGKPKAASKCLLCLKSPQDGREADWAEFNDNVATGDACRVCIEVNVSCWPELSFREFASRFHDKGSAENKEFRTVVTGARVLLKNRLAGKPTPEILPPTYVRARNERLLCVYYDVLYVSVSELTRLCGGLGPKQLGLKKPMQLSLEDNSTLKGYIFSLEGVDPSVAQSLRKIRVERRLGVQMDEELMQPRQQLIKGRERHVFEHVCDGHAAHFPSKLFKGNLRTKFTTLQSLIQFAAQSEKDPADGEDYDEDEEGEEEEPLEDDDLVEDSDMEVEEKMSLVSGGTGLTGVSRISKLKRGPLSIVPQKMDLGSVGAAVDPQPKKSLKRKREDADEPVDPSELATVISDENLQLDEEMQAVADALGNTPPCLQGLLVSRVLSGEKPGHQIKGVSARTLLGTMQLKKQKEAEKLEKRIDLVSHLSALVHGKIRDMKAHELALHLQHCDNSEVKLTFDLRCQYLQRRGDDLIANLQECSKKSAAQTIVESIVRCFGIWIPMKAKSEAEITAWQIWSDEKKSLQKQADDGTIADEELESMIEKQAQVQIPDSPFVSFWMMVLYLSRIRQCQYLSTQYSAQNDCLAGITASQPSAAIVMMCVCVCVLSLNAPGIDADCR